MASQPKRSAAWAKAPMRFDPHAIRQGHRQSEIQIRKQSRTDRLRQRRGIQLSPEDQTQLLQACASGVASFLKKPGYCSGEPALDETFRKHHPTTELFLNRFLKEHEAESRSFATSLLQMLQQSADDMSRHYTLSILVEMTASLAEAADTKDRILAEQDNYYGRTPLRWEDLFCASDQGSNIDIVSLLANILSSTPAGSSNASTQQQQQIQLVQSCWMYWVVYATETTLRRTIPTYWPLLVTHLPVTSPCCAAILFREQSHYGMDLLSAGTFDWPRLLACNAPATLPHQLQYAGAMMLEGLCRRESAVGDLLSCDPIVVQAICDHVATQPPLLRVLQYLAPGRAPLFQAATPGVLVQLEQHKTLEAIRVLHILQGGEAMTRLMQLLISHLHPWKREVIHTMASNPHDVVDYFATTGAESRDDIIQVLVKLLKVNDTAQPSLTVLDGILRTIPESRTTFEEHDGVDELERFSLSSSVEANSDLADVAGRLVDDLFDDDEHAGVALDSAAASAEPFTSFSFAPPQGRGRGRTVPAWQQNRN